MNEDIARILYSIGEYLSMQNVPFKPRAYEKAGASLADLPRSVRDIYEEGGVKALRRIPGVGEAIAMKIEEFLKTGKIRYYEDLKKTAPVRLDELLSVEGLGPKSVRRLYDELGVKTLKDLALAAKKGKIAELKGFGEKSEAKILRHIAFAKTSGERKILGLVAPKIESLAARLRGVRGVKQAETAGSIRRRKDTIGDGDILAVSSNPALVMEAFVRMPEVIEVIARGDTKSSVKIRPGMNVDLRVVPEESYGAALLYFTGSKEHNVMLRQAAIGRGYKLNEYGLWRGTKRIAGKTEREVYEALGLDFIPPEIREGLDEIELARDKALPRLIEYGSLEGDLQVQTDWSDGRASIETMAREAAARGLRYIAVTDHTKRLSMTNGLDEKRLRAQMAEIDRVNQALKGKITVLKGTECDILKDGAMDIDPSVLSELDVVGGSVHSYFELPREEQTSRIVKAMRNPHVDIIFHPTGRILNRRKPYEVDMDELIRRAKETGTVLEVDAYPDRADLSDEHVRKAVREGVKLAIDSDAHGPGHFGFLEWGIAQARRGGAEKNDIINAWPLEKMKSFLKKQANRNP